MYRLALVLACAAAVVGCDVPDRASGANPDAVVLENDASGGGQTDPNRVPFSTTGTTPGGSLDDVRYMSVEYIGGNCPGTYFLRLYRTNAIEESELVTFWITIPLNAEPPTGTITGNARAGTATTKAVSFEIVHLDAPPSDIVDPPTVRIAGRLTVDTSGWSVDFNVDATTTTKVCLIF